VTLSAEIIIDYSKCLVPFYCKKCILACPQAVFQVRPVKLVKFKETDPQEPGSFKLTADYVDKCVICNRCVEVCPENALQIKY